MINRDTGGAWACIMTSSFSLLVKLCLFVLASAVTACCSKKFRIQIKKCVHKRQECPARLWKIRRPVSTSWEMIQPLSWLFKLKTSIWTHYSPPDPWGISPGQNTSEQQRRLQQNFSPPLAKDPLFSSHMLHVRKRQLLTNSICFNRAIGVQFNVADLRNNDRFVICIWNSPNNVSCVFLWVSVTSSSESIGFCDWERPLHPLTVIIKVVCSTFVTYVKCRQ